MINYLIYRFIFTTIIFTVYIYDIFILYLVINIALIATPTSEILNTFKYFILISILYLYWLIISILFSTVKVVLIVIFINEI